MTERQGVSRTCKSALTKVDSSGAAIELSLTSQLVSGDAGWPKKAEQPGGGYDLAS